MCVSWQCDTFSTTVSKSCVNKKKKKSYVTLDNSDPPPPDMPGNHKM